MEYGECCVCGFEEIDLVAWRSAPAASVDIEEVVSPQKFRTPDQERIENVIFP